MSNQIAERHQTKTTIKAIAEIRNQWTNGHRRKARKLCYRLLKEKPDLPDALHISALMHHQDGNALDAIRDLERACNSFDPQTVYFTDLSAILSASGYPAQAKTVLTQALKRKPLDPKLLLQMGIFLTGNNEARQAVPFLKRAIALAPSEWLAWNAMGAVSLAHDDLDAAIGHFRTAGKYARESGHMDGYIDTLISEGECLKELGQINAARAIFKDVLARHSGNIRAWHCLTLIDRVSADHPSRQVMINKNRSRSFESIPDGQKELLLFGLAKNHMEHGEIDAAMKALNDGNRIKRRNIQYSPQTIENVLGITKAAFPAERFSDLQTPDEKGDQPQHVFIVGMPRSGTTLVEQILVSHPEMYGAGELDTLGYHQDALIEHQVKQGQPRDEVLKFSDAFIQTLGTIYCKEARARVKAGSGSMKSMPVKRIIDKMPANFTRARLIALMHPDPRIIHCRRDAMDTCFSCYSRRFGSAQNFSYDQMELGAFYNNYLKFMDHWRNILPAHRFIEVDYEDIVNDLEGQARRLITFTGLPWDEACLKFYENRRQVRTHSTLQVRQPIYRSSIGAWHPYTRYLGPLMDTLGIDPATGQQRKVAG
ncbi:tetratricopeptide repeat-containing sulfotransferase family protein [Thalassospira xiamenensis]|uniref:Sulfotransferase family protein n=1 Tax=Thalassospira xiamenensis TaxID=220697 RepID=A0A285TMJ3_9PROT|nr:tetratricopeptide repeat-containing sulfotransferase family protein [Thalassospira xiamenensis]SOC23371.1 Sulfotransferase family protein [Thalassospira xiamenensis]